jgi:hypothetical protein
MTLEQIARIAETLETEDIEECTEGLKYGETDEYTREIMETGDKNGYTVVWDYNGNYHQEELCYRILQTLQGGAVYEGPIAQMRELIKEEEEAFKNYMDPTWDYERPQDIHPIHFQEERRKKRDITTRAVNQWLTLSREEADMARERTLRQYEPFDEKWVRHNDKHKTQCVPSMMYDRQTEWHLYCIMKETEKVGWRNDIHQWFAARHQEWIKREAREKEPRAFRETLIEKYMPGIQTKDEDLIKLMDRFRVEVESIHPYLEKPEMLRVFRDLITPYIYVKLDVREEQPYMGEDRPNFMKIVNQQMCQLVGGTRESFTWIAPLNDVQISARILERFLNTRQPEEIQTSIERNFIYSMPLIKVKGVDNKEPKPPSTAQERSLALAFFNWEKMACVQNRIERNVIDELHEKIKFMKRFQAKSFRQLPEIFNNYTLPELEELIYEIYVTAIVTASGRFIPMAVERLKRWLSNTHILARFGYPPEKLTELLVVLIPFYIKKERKWRYENADRDEHEYAHPLIQRLAGLELTEEEKRQPEMDSSSEEDWY